MLYIIPYITKAGHEMGELLKEVIINNTLTKQEMKD